MIKKRQMVVEAGEEGLTTAECSTLWPRNPHLDGDHCPFAALSKIATEPQGDPISNATRSWTRCRPAE